MSTDATPANATPANRRLIAGLIIVGSVGLFLAANAHLLYVALKSQPDCVQHLKSPGHTDGDYRAANSAC